jgi:Ca-activated chloride channel family protein
MGFSGGFGGFCGAGGFPGGPGMPPPALTDPSLTRGTGTSPKAKGATTSPATDAPAKVADVAKDLVKNPGDAGKARGGLERDKLDKVQSELEKFDEAMKKREAEGKSDPKKALDADDRAKQELAQRFLRTVKEQRENVDNYDQARRWYGNGQYKEAQSGRVGVDVAVCANNLRLQERLTQTANRNVYGRNCLELGGLWIDDGFTADMKTVVVKAQSDAYFKILDKYPAMKDVYRLGNHLVFVTPSKTALVVDLNDGKSSLTDDEITALFTAKKEEKKEEKKAEPKADKK